MKPEPRLLLQGADNTMPDQEYHGSSKPIVSGTTISAECPPSIGTEPGQQEPAPALTSDRGEKESAAKAALQDAVRKVRELAATSSYDIVGDIRDIDKAITELVGGGGWKETLQASHPPNPTPPQPAKKARTQRRNDIDVERSRPCEVQRTLMEEWPLRGSPDEEGEDEKEKEEEGIQSVPRSDRSPVIQVFYRTVPSTMPDPGSIISDDDFKKAHDTSHQREKPQRALINSTLLIKDMENICGLQLPRRPHELIPPFKLLVYNWAGIQNAIESLEYEQKAVVSKERHVTIDVLQSDLSGGESQEMNMNKEQQQSNIQTDENLTSNVDLGTSVIKEKLSLRISHLKVLVDFIKTDLGHLLGLRMKIRDATLESITFEEMCHLYAPGDLIINRKASVDHLHQVYAATGGRMRLCGRSGPFGDSSDSGAGTWTDVVLDCIRMRWDGTHIGPFRLIHRIRHYIGERQVTDLDFYPVRFRSNPEDICGALEARGRKVLECYGHRKYEGLTVDPTGQQPIPEPGNRPRNMKPPDLTYDSITGTSQGGQEIESDVYVDIKTYHQTLDPILRVYDKLRRSPPSERETAEDLPGGRGENDYRAGDHDVDEARSDAFMNENFHLIDPKTPEELAKNPSCLALLSRAMPAYEFRSREWIWVDITKVEPIDKREETRTRGWKDLVIDSKYRRLLESLVNNHMSPAEQRKTQSQTGESTPTSQIDLIQGTGKTSTAEAIAAYTGKPLYAITCGDIGLSADNVEANLLKHTRLAEKWGCVLLLDEADVFLARRGWNDVHRNAMVSIFLRRLEYYSGILFLTTNIVGLIDEAFKSRIHVALRYDKINDATTERIWQNLLRRIDRDNQASNVKIRFDESELLDFAMEHYDEHAKDESTWNARQIRNAFSTAIAMGQFDRLERIREEGVSPEEALASGNKSLKTIRLTKSNFRKIANIGDDFEQYINSVRGDDAENARMNMQRDDFYLQQRAPRRKDYKRPAAYADEPVNRDEADERDSEMEESQRESDVRSRRMRRSQKMSSDDEADRLDDE
ncbi:AAA family ATPase [Apiospora rasikravindrae]|uniref:AAA family ATPase n=1 Tax=Apiospora rasikravindrae TaxID=990691 RepID=A0ABR1SJN4_9PEZI